MPPRPPHWFESLARLLEARRIYAVDSHQTDGTRLHSQPGLELNLTLRGRGTLRVGRQRHPLSAGTLVLIPEPHVHQLSVATPGSYVRSVLCVAPVDAHPMVPALRALLQSAPFRRPQRLQLGGGAAREVRERIARIASEENAPWSTEMALAQVYELLILVARLTSQPAPEQTATARLAEAVATHVAAHLDADLTTKTVAAHFGISREHLSRLFHRHFGTTYQRHVLRQRLLLARRLLAEADRETPLLEIALGAGFQSHAHFTRLFREHEGVTPTEFRQLLTP